MHLQVVDEGRDNDVFLAITVEIMDKGRCIYAAAHLDHPFQRKIGIAITI